MKCPKCGGTASAVVESRPGSAGEFYRRRCCGKCGAGFVTMELAAPAGTKMPSRPGRVRASQAMSCDKGPRGTGSHLQALISGGAR